MPAKNLSSLGILYTDRRDFYISPKVTRELWTDITPFTTVISNKGIISTPDPDFKMFEHRSGWIRQQMSVNAASPPTWSTGNPGDTVTVPVDTIVGLESSVAPSMIGLLVEIWNSTLVTYKGTAFITAVNTGGATVTLKALGNPRASDFKMVNLADNDVLYVIGTAFGEGTSAPEAYSDELQVVWNSTEIFKTSVEVTGTLLQAALRGYSDELVRLRLEKNREHKIQKERAFLLGVRSGGIGALGGDSHTGHQTDADGKVVRTTMGVIPTIFRYGSTSGPEQNIFAISKSSFNYDNFVDITEKLFQYVPTSGTKDVYCGRGFLSFFSKLSTGSGFIGNSGFNVQLMATQRDSLGFNFRTLESPHGTLRLIPTPVLRDAYNETACIVDPDDIRYVQYRPMVYKTNIKTDNAPDLVKDVWQSDEGIGMTLVQKHAVLYLTA